jgi:hypothetical protein
MKIKIFAVVFSLAVSSIVGFGQINPGARYMDPADPNRDPNWNWTTCCTGHTIYYQTQNGIQTQNNVQTPFFTQGHTLSDAATNDKKDMWQQDGWTLAYRDFGTPTIAPPLPYFILYNKYRGVFRVMIYNARESLSSAFLMTLSLRSSSPKPPIFTFTNNSYDSFGAFDFYTSYPNGYQIRSQGGNPNQIESVLGKVHQLNDWFWADFVVAGYSQNLPINTVLHMDLSLIDESKISLKSTKFTLEQVLSKSSVSNSFADVANKTISAIDQGNRFFSSVDNVRAKFKETADRNKGEPWLKNALGSIANSGAASIVPYLGGLLGFVNYFIGGSDQQPMSFKGALELEGTISITKPLVSYDFALSTAIPELPEYYKPVQSITWGLVNVSFPYCYRDLVAYAEPTEICTYCSDQGGYYDEYGNYIRSCEPSCELIDNSTYEQACNVLDIFTNPNAGMTLQSIRYSYIGTSSIGNNVYIKQQPTPLTNKQTFLSATRGQITYLPSPSTFFALEYTFFINNPTKNSNRTVVLYKVYPFNAIYLANAIPGVKIYDSFNYQSGNTSGARLGGDVVIGDVPKESKIDPTINETKISEVYPNPFSTLINNEITINYDIEDVKGALVTIKIYNLLGEEIKVIANEKFHKKGLYAIKWDVLSNQKTSLSSGIYIVKMQVGDKLSNKRFVLKN